MNKKKILSLALVLLLIGTISFGTLAWFNDTNEITNTFLIASSDDSDNTGDSIFSVDVWEETDTNKDGTSETYGKGPDKDSENPNYENILPGDLLLKTPYVENTGAYEQYIRVKVTFSHYAWWSSKLNQFRQTEDLTTLLRGIDSQMWWRAETTEQVGDTITYTYYLQKKLAPNDAPVPLFTHVEIPHEFTQFDMRNVGSFNIKVVAQAVQTENVGANALEAFKTVYNET